MARHATSTSFKRGINARTGGPAMTVEELKERQKYYYQRYKAKTLIQTWERQIKRCGWTPKEYYAALDSQGGVCYICLGVNKTGRRLAADHCHKTKRRRHLLCQRCNMVLGLIEENRDLLRRMEEYCAS